MEPIAFTPESRDRILDLMKQAKCQPTDGIETYPVNLQGILLQEGYIGYTTTDKGMLYKWVDGALAALLGTKEPDAPRQVQASAEVDDHKGLRLRLRASVREDDPVRLTITPEVSYGQETKSFPEYDLVLARQDSNKPGIYNLCVHISEIIEQRVLCVLTDVAAQFNPDDAEDISWQREDEYTFKSEPLGIAIRLDNESEVNDQMALRVVLETNTAYADAPGYTLLTITGNGTDYYTHSDATYLFDKSDPLTGIHNTHKSWTHQPKNGGDGK